MARFQTKYLCQQCGYESTKWLGRCPECDAWDSFTEEVSLKEKAGSTKSVAASFSSASAQSGSSSVSVNRSIVSGGSAPTPITQVETLNAERLSSGVPEFDRVLGGGFVPGALVLVGGDPGIGKSTLLTQVAALVANENSEKPVLYLSGEESAQQIKLRSGRLGSLSDRFLVGVETEIALILHHLERTMPSLAIVDSIQTMQDGTLESAPGNVSQVRTCAAHLARFAKTHGVPIVLIGHVTKDGSLAGPRVLEHIVDAVLSFEGDRHHLYRLLRAVKNRFGSTDELGIFEMHETGLAGVENPSALLLSERVEGGTGSAVTSNLEGSRALLVEVQALTSRSNLASPRRAVTGMDPNRVNLLLAVLEKRVGLKLAEQDVFVNVAGGVKIAEPSADLAVALAVASSYREQPVHPTTMLIGEVGLAGEIRAVSQTEKRLREASRQGFTRAVISRHSAEKLPRDVGLEVVPIAHIGEAFLKALVTRNDRGGE